MLFSLISFKLVFLSIILVSNCGASKSLFSRRSQINRVERDVDAEIAHEYNYTWIEETEYNFNLPVGAENSNVLRRNDKFVFCNWHMESKWRLRQAYDVLDLNDTLPRIWNLCSHFIHSVLHIDKYHSVPETYKIEHLGRIKTIKENALYSGMKNLLHLSIDESIRDQSEYLQKLVEEDDYFSGFINSVVYTLASLKMDGIYLNSIFYKQARENFVLLLKAMKKELKKFLLTVELDFSSRSNITDDITLIAAEVDLLFAVGFGDPSRRQTRTSHQSPLYSILPGDENFYDNLLYLSTLGLPFKKLILEVPLFGNGYAFTNLLTNPFGINNTAEPIASLNPFPLTESREIVAYSTICFKILNGTGWKMYFDTKARVPFAKKPTRWISFDNPSSIKEKVDLAMNFGLKGVMAHSIDLDDFNGRCLAGAPYPILRTLNFALSSAKPETISMSMIPYIFLSMIAIGLLILVFCLYSFTILSLNCRRKFKNSGKPSLLEDDTRPEDLEMVTAEVSYEISPKDYRVDQTNVLGSGAFGIVFKGIVNGMPVAVKSTKPGSDQQYVNSLISELKILTYLGKHPNIVNLIGASTVNVENGSIYIFVELCEMGNLLDFLRRSRKKFISADKENEFNNVITDECVTKEDLVNWSYQIANGLKHLSSKNLIHADLALRNVLLFERNIVKLTDFGLSRKLYNYSVYAKTNQEPLPWRWMAIESLRDLTFSVHSDMWSYGITIWEIFCLAETPYPGLSWTLNFVHMLDDGLRLQMPKHSTDSIYEFMLLCWEKQPEKRPSAEQAVNFFLSLLEEHYPYECL